jgi:hypothetical protein
LLDENGNDLATVNEAFRRACSFEHEAVASLLLERSIVLDPELGKHIDGNVGRSAFIRYFIDNGMPGFDPAAPAGPWQAFVMDHVMRAVHDADLTGFVTGLQREPWLLDDARVEFQAGLIARATLRDRADFITTLLDLGPALVRRQPPPPSQAIEFALTYAKLHLIPILTRVWPLPDDLPHAAGIGNLVRVKQWFDESGAPALGDLDHHFPYNTHTGMDYHWSTSRVQVVLDTALAWSVINRHFDVADFLLAHGADINTRWSSHEPASILHELVGQVATGENPGGNYESMQFLIDRGIDMTIEDYRWNSTARGWARYAANDERMAQWLEEAERRRRT